MIFIDNLSQDPYFNIAAEEYLLKNKEQDVCMFYRNKPSVIVGRHQNILAETNHEYIKKNNIKVVRRLSGGGTVYHDLGNLNFTFITSGNYKKKINFRKYTLPIVNALKNKGLDVRFSGRNDLLLANKKISGNAEHIYKNKILHHGTLLFDTKIDKLFSAISTKKTYKDKSIKSVRSKVANISAFMQNKQTIEEFKFDLINSVRNQYEKSNFYKFTENDKAEINKLRTEKYTKWEWNYGNSPKFTTETTIDRQGKKLPLIITVEKGQIEKIQLQKEDAELTVSIEEYFIGKPFEKYFG